MDINKILQASEQTFFAKRFDQVNLDHIAHKIGIKKPTLYYYFDNKKHLFIETLQYSKDKYINSLEKTLEKNDIHELLKWYLTYPQEQKNLFAISLQRNYYEDLKIQNIILQWKKNIFKSIKKHLNQHHQMSKLQTYLFINLLDKLSRNNCIDNYCLDYDIEDISNEIQNIFLKNC